METVYYLCNFLSRVVATRPNTGSAEGGARAATALRQERQEEHGDPSATDSYCSANSNQKMTLFTLFWLVYPLFMFFFSPMIPEIFM